jgi:6-phosphofructokinase 1
VLKREKYCLIVVAEGLVDSDGNYLAASASTDAFGHAQLGGAGDAPLGHHRAKHPRREGPRRQARHRAALRRARRRARPTSTKRYLAGQAAVEAADRTATPTRWSRCVRGDGDQYTTRDRPRAALPRSPTA